MGRDRLLLISERLSKVATWVAVSFLLAMMFLVFVDVALRKFTTRPLLGAHELIEIMLVPVAFFSFGYCWNQHGHINIELLLRRFSPRLKAACTSLAALVGLIVFGVLSWIGFKFAINSLNLGVTTDVLRIPLFPAKFCLAFGSLIFSFTLSVSLIDSLISFHRTFSKN